MGYNRTQLKPNQTCTLCESDALDSSLFVLGTSDKILTIFIEVQEFVLWEAIIGENSVTRCPVFFGFGKCRPQSYKSRGTRKTCHELRVSFIYKMSLVLFP